MTKYKILLATAIILVAVALPLGMLRLAAAQAVSESYASDTPLSPGIIVQLDTKDPSKVLPATQATANRIHGVVVAANATPVTLSNNQQSQQVFVATSGNYQVLVSDQNGAIQTGDYITISAIAGVGMRASSNQTVVLGKALGGFDGADNVQGSSPLNENGHEVTVHLGYVPIDLSLSHNPLYQPAKTAQVNNYLTRFAQSVTNRNVSLARIYISMIVLLVSMIIAGVLLYAGVRTSMTALGRNPLAGRSIIHSLLQVVFTSLMVFLFGVFAVYLLLKL